MFRLLLLVLVLTNSAVTAQWSKDPLNPLELADGAGAPRQVHLAEGPQGSLYLAYLVAGVTKLQRIDAAGRALWPAAVSVGNLLNIDSRIDLASDPSGNAWVSWADVGLAVFQFDPDGNQLWSNTSLETGNPILQHSLTVTDTGHGVVGWVDPNGSFMAQRLDPLGTPQWDPPFTRPSTAQVTPLVKAIGGDAVAVCWTSGDGVFIFDTHLHAQKLDANGLAVWGPDPVVVFDQGSIFPGTEPSVTPDGQGGAYFGFHELDFTAFLLQRVIADGTQSLGTPGAGTSPASAPNFAGGGRLVLRPETGETYIAWQDKGFEAGEPTADRGISAQKFAPDGTPLWGPDGVVCAPLTDVSKDDAHVVPLPDGVAVAWVENSRRIRVLTLGEDGTPKGGAVDVGDSSSHKSDFQATAGAFGDVVAVWRETLGDDVLGQNLTPSGHFGPAPGAVFRTAGPNPMSYTASVGPLGGLLDLSVDLTTTGHAFALLVAYLAPAEIPLGGPGSDFALVLPVGPELFSFPLLPGPTAEVKVTIPAHPTLCGVTLYSQAVHLDGALSLRASNAQDLYIGI